MDKVADARSCGVIDCNLEQAQRRYLAEALPHSTQRRIHWSGGSTQVIEAGNGSPVLLLHGGLGDAFQWAPLMSALAAKYRLIAVDRPGHGLADSFDYRAEPLLQTATRFIEEVLNEEELAAVPIIANSMGGLWAAAFALQHPRRTPRLVLVGSPAGIARPIPALLRLGMAPGLRTLVRRAMTRPTPRSVRSFWNLLVTHPERLSENFVVASAASQLRNHSSWFALLDAAIDVRGMKRELVLGEAWRRLESPTTFVWGDKDRWAKVCAAEAVVAANPNARLVTIADAGHAPWFDQPEAVATAVATALSGSELRAR